MQAQQDFETMFRDKVLSNIHHTPMITCNDPENLTALDPHDVDKLYIEDMFISFCDMILSNTLSKVSSAKIDDLI